MAINPETNMKEFLTFVIAAGLRVFGPQATSADTCLTMAQELVDLAEKKLGKIT